MHLLESMAYVGQKPWHGLGTQLARQQPIETWKQQAGMDWKIEESEVRYITGGQNVGAINAFPGNKVLYRSDTKVPLAVVSKRFRNCDGGSRVGCLVTSVCSKDLGASAMRRQLGAMG